MFSQRALPAFVLAIAISAAAPAGAESVSVKGEVIAINLKKRIVDGPALVTLTAPSGAVETIAVPSMGIRLCPAKDNMANVDDMRPGDRVTARGARAGDGSIVPCDDPDDWLHVQPEVARPELGFRFAYRKSPEGYILFEMPDGMSGHPDFVYGVSLVRRSDLIALADDAGPRDGPKSIDLRVYRNPRMLHAPVWVMRNENESSSALASGAVEETVLAGANAVRYRADGLYQNDVVVAASDGRIYLWAAMYDAPADPVRTDFAEILDSFEFTPPE